LWTGSKRPCPNYRWRKLDGLSKNSAFQNMMLIH